LSAFVKNFQDELQRYRYEDVHSRIQAKNAEDVKRALMRDRILMDDFIALLSSAAAAFLEEMALKAHRLTRQRFGNTILMHAPL
jgi:2-iminoacetate synthase